MAKRLFPIVCPTRSPQGLCGQTVATIYNVLWQMDMEPMYCQYEGHGYSFVRTETFERLRKLVGVDHIRGLMIDDDILMKDQVAFSKAIQLADEYQWNFVAPYRIKDGHCTICHASGQKFSLDEYAKLKPWDRVPKAGLGFYYGDLPTTYEFHEHDPHGGEDLNFFHDNPQLDIRQIDLDLIHIKAIGLGMKSTMDIAARDKSYDPVYEAQMDQVWFRSVAKGEKPPTATAAQGEPPTITDDLRARLAELKAKGGVK